MNTQHPPDALCLFIFSKAMCDFGAHAGADVQTQDVQFEPQRLPEDLPLPEVAKNGRTSR